MVAITLPDGSVRKYDGSVSGAQVAADIGPGLAKAALAVRINGEMKDLSLELTEDCDMSIVTTKDEDALDLLRHDAAHVMAQAVQELFDDVQVTIGPSIENGYYYDFATKKPFSQDDLEKIQKKMEEIVDRDLLIEREVWDRDELIAKFESMGEKYKAEIIASIPEGEDVTVYRQGDWFDMCRGPHLPSTGKLGKAFQLMKVAGAYWRGDSNNEMLQRIYGTAWADKKALRQYLHMLEEAEKRDHRKLGKEMELFHFQEEAVGSVFWHPHGWKIYRTVQNYMRGRLEEAGYVEVNTPQMVDRKLWEDSGHWEKFREHMFITGAEDKVLAIKPMNCPCHVQIFNQGLKSYRDLPLRMAEFGSCFRNEPSGALHGLMRVRSFTQDDAHIFCSPDQIISETKIFCDLLLSVYKNFGFEEVKVKFSDRPEVRAGDDATWDKAESALKEATEAAGLEWTLNPGEGAFYGPKLEFVLRDAIGRDWQCGTLQVDFVLPERLGADYVGEDGNKHRPVMLHRAILGSFERFIGILIENFAGRFPLWLAPKQVVVASITSDHNGYAQEVCDLLKKQGLSCDTDFRNESINYKIREHSHAKVPVILVVGGKEVENRTVAMRRLGGKTQEILALDEVVDKLVTEAATPQGT
ncbi:MAG: threonine--tRNA ligase [Methylocystaceae bacterium]|nr:threonine--tRNA ligase [Methylocystaceae bacterium]